MSGSASAEAVRGAIEEFVAGLSAAELDHWLDHWLTQAHPAQLPPDSDWTIWLMIGGRGAGKTRAGAEYVRALALGEAWAGCDGPVTPIALVSETQAQARAVMVEGVSGILAVCGEDAPAFDRGRGELRWANGTVARIFGASEPDALRGHQFAAAWCDELAKWPRAEEAWDQLQFCLRLGARPRQLVTTTPRPIALLKRLRGEAGVAETHIRTEENAANLAPDFLQRIVARYAGTALGRQELDGEFIEDAPDALWKRGAIEAGRIPAAPKEMKRIVVAVDPPVTSHRRSDACGIVVAGRGGEGAVVLDDLTLQPAPPLHWAERAVSAFHRWGADAIVAEVNQGGELVAEMIAQADRAVPVKQVRASRGKWLRAEPVAALYARSLVRHAGFFPELEDEMCAFTRDGAGGGSPDRVDALVWAITELMLTAEAGEPRFYQF